MKERFLEIKQKIADKREEISEISLQITQLKNEVIALLPYNIGDVVRKERYNEGFWRIDRIIIDDEVLDSSDKVRRKLYCTFIKKDGEIGERTTDFWTSDEIEYLGSFEEWLQNR